MTFSEIYDLVNRGGLLGGAIIVAFSFWTKRIVNGKDLREEQRRTRFWMKLFWIEAGIMTDRSVPSFKFDGEEDE